MSMNYKNKADIHGFNPFSNNRSAFNSTYKSIVWQILLNSLNAIDTGLTTSAATPGSVFRFVLEHCDFPTNNSIGFSNLINSMKANGSAANSSAYWNTSIQDLFDYLFGITNPEWFGNEDAKNTKDVIFRIWDIMSANAGYSFEREPWVIPWKNRVHDSYSKVRGTDALNAPLKDDNNLQFTNGNEYEHVAEETELKHSYLSFDENGSIIFTSSTGAKFNAVQYILEDGAISMDYDENVGDNEIVGVQLLNNLVHFLNETQVHDIVTEKDKWIRLLMPKNTRNVEVEDLNRNFWVIGQVLDLILYYLYDPNGVLGSTFKNMAIEIEELWNNINYLWGAVIANGEDETPKEVTWHVEEIIINPFDLQYAHLYIDDQLAPEFFTNGEINDQLRTSVAAALSNYNHMYINQNLALIPVIEDGFYEQNYHDRLHFPGLLYLQRFTKQDDRIVKIENPQFNWYSGIAAKTRTFDGISSGSFGSGFYDDGYNFHYCAINTAKSDDCYYGAFRPRAWIRDTNGTELNHYLFNLPDLPDSLELDINWTDAGLLAMTGQYSRQNEQGLDQSIQTQDDEPNILVPGPDVPQTINSPRGGLYMGELVSKKIPQDILILPREFRVPIWTDNTQVELPTIKINNVNVPISRNVSDLQSSYNQLAKEFSENVYHYLAQVPEAYSQSNNTARIKGLSKGESNTEDNSTSSVWVFRMASVEKYSSSNSTINITNATQVSLPNAISTKNAKYVEPFELLRYLFFRDENGKIYHLNTQEHPDMFGFVGLKYRANAALYTPVKANPITYDCQIENIYKDGGEHKNFYVICQGTAETGSKLTENNWAVVFVYGRDYNPANYGDRPSSISSSTKENVITFFYPENNKCEMVRYHFDGSWHLYDYRKGNGTPTPAIVSPYWSTYFNDTSKIYHSKRFMPDYYGDYSNDIYPETLNMFAAGLGSRLQTRKANGDPQDVMNNLIGR